MSEKIIAHPKMLNIPEKHSYFALYSDKQKRQHPSDPQEWSYWKKVLQFPVNLTVGEMMALIVERIAAAEAQVAELQAQLCEADFDFGGWRSIQRRYEAQIDALRSENQRLLALLEPCPECGCIQNVQAGDMSIHECDRCYHCWPAKPRAGSAAGEAMKLFGYLCISAVGMAAGFAAAWMVLPIPALPPVPAPVYQVGGSDVPPLATKGNPVGAMCSAVIGKEQLQWPSSDGNCSIHDKAFPQPKPK